MSVLFNIEKEQKTWGNLVKNQECIVKIARQNFEDTHKMKYRYSNLFQHVSTAQRNKKRGNSQAEFEDMSKWPENRYLIFQNFFHT